MSSRTKLIALAVVAVLLPTTVISIIQYSSLLELERQTKMAARENLRQAAGGLSARTAGYFREVGLKALGEFRRDWSPDPARLQQIEEHFDQVLETTPAIESIFVASDCSCDSSAGAALVQSRSGSLKVAGKQGSNNHEVQHLANLYQRAMMLASQLPQSERQALFSYEPSCEKFSFQSYVFFSLTNTKGVETGFAGVKLNTQHFLDDFLPNVLPDFMDSELALAVRDDRDQLVYTNSDRTSHQLQMGLGPMLPQWQVSLDYKGASIEELARDNFRNSMMLSVFVLVLLATGITLMLRATSREMRLAEAKSSFVANVSHELKTPLALIRLFAETLELGRAKTPEKAREYYRIINNESSRLTQLINNILDFSKIEAGRKEYAFERADAGQVVEEVVRTYEYPIRNDGFDLSVSIEQGLEVNMDRAAISQAVLNLLNNAVKYSDFVKQIGVTVRREDDHAAIEVSDSGIGIPAAEQDRIFDKFYRISDGLVHDRKGTGLGLTLVKHIVEAHRGTIRVNSTPAKGSRFMLLLPLLREVRSEAATLAYESPNYRG